MSPQSERRAAAAARAVRRRRVGAALVLAAAASVTGLSGLWGLAGRPGPPQRAAAASPVAPHLPATVEPPDPWSSASVPRGPLAALGLGMRREPAGLWGSRERVAMFGVSAVDGRSGWVDLPGVRTDDEALADWFALSPDGRWIGWARRGPRVHPGRPGPVVGWAVSDTVSGRVRRLADPRAPRLRETSATLRFSGDSHYLLTSDQPASARGSRQHAFVAWDVGTGRPSILERPGHYWLPVLGSAPSGVVWARGTTLRRQDPATGGATSYQLPRTVLGASWAPDGEAFAYLGRDPGRPSGTWRLYAGRTLAEARDRPLALSPEPGELLGWRDSRHVVVGHFRRDVQVVDVVSGAVETVDLAGQGKTFNPPLLAEDLWRTPLRGPAAREGARDPRTPWRWAAGATLLVAGGSATVARRRRRPRVG